MRYHERATIRERVWASCEVSSVTMSLILDMKAAVTPSVIEALDGYNVNK